MSVEEIADCPLFITGSAAEIRDTLERRRERTGISYVVIQGKDPGAARGVRRGGGRAAGGALIPESRPR